MSFLILYFDSEKYEFFQKDARKFEKWDRVVKVADAILVMKYNCGY